MSQLDVGSVEKDGVPPRAQSFTATMPGGSTARVTTSEPWLVAAPDTVSSGGLVKVSITPQHLVLSGRQWTMRNLIEPLIDKAKQLPDRAWAVVAGGLLIGIWLRPIWQAAVLIVGGFLGVQLTGWLVSVLLRRVVVQPTEHIGQVIVDDGATQKAVTVRVKALPLQYRFTLGWLALIVLVSAEVLTMGIGLAWLVQQLGS